MPVKWLTTDYPGVRYYDHPTRKIAVGAVKRPDKYFAIRYQINGKRVEEGLGWSSSPEKWTEKTAFAKLTELKEAAKNQKPNTPTRLSEERELNAEKKLLADEERDLQQDERLRKERENITAERFFYDTYWPTIPTHRKEASQLHDETHFRLWLGPVIGHKPLKTISHIDLERVKKRMLDAVPPKSPRTIQYVFATFRQIWNMAKASKIVSEDSPSKSVKLPKINNERCRFLDAAEAKTLLTSLKQRDITTYQMAALSLYTGMRAGEIFGLTWRDVDTKRETIFVSDPKNHESRYVHITKPVADIFSTMTVGEPQDLLFTIKTGKSKGKAFNEAPATFAETVRELGMNDGIEEEKYKIVFHTLRHTFSSWIVGNGVDLYTLTKLTGHKTLAMGKRYAHLTDKALRDAARSLEGNAEEVKATDELPAKIIQLKVAAK